MEEGSISPRGAIGSPPKMFRIDGIYVQHCPAWWSRESVPSQVHFAAKKLEGVIGPETYPAGLIPGARAKGTKPNPTGALLYGSPGRGKTSTSLLIGWEWGKAGGWSMFQDALELSIRIRGTWNRNALETQADIIERLFRPDLLILDDVAKRSAPEDQEIFSALINGRQLRGKPTILTTNADLRTPEGRQAFAAGCDNRILERFTGLDFCCDKWGTNLRREIR